MKTNNWTDILSSNIRRDLVICTYVGFIRQICFTANKVYDQLSMSKSKLILWYFLFYLFIWRGWSCFDGSVTGTNVFFFFFFWIGDMLLALVGFKASSSFGDECTRHLAWEYERKSAMKWMNLGLDCCMGREWYCEPS